jgi:hypothetical protein
MMNRGRESERGDMKGGREEGRKQKKEMGFFRR